MLEDLREQLWEAEYLTPVSPQDLLENAKDPDYKSINFTPKHDKLEVTLLFQDNNELITAVYIFNSENKLQHCYMIEPNGKSIIYDREQEIETIMAKIILIKESSNIIKTTA